MQGLGCRVWGLGFVYVYCNGSKAKISAGTVEGFLFSTPKHPNMCTTLWRELDSKVGLANAPGKNKFLVDSAHWALTATRRSPEE